MPVRVSPREVMPALYTAKLLEVLDEHGVSTRGLLRNAGIKNEVLRDPEQLIHIPRYLDLLESVLEQTDLPGLGLLVSRRTTLRDHGILGYAVLSSANIREALQCGVRYVHLTGCLLQLDLLEAKKESRLLVSPRTNWRLSDAAVRYLIEEFVGNVQQIGQPLGIKPCWFTKVTLAYREPEYRDLYVDLLGCSARFGQHETAIRFLPDVLDQAVEFGDAQISAMCEAECQLLSEDLRLDAGLTARVHRMLTFSPGRIPTMDAAARMLNTSIRTLRRHLQQENTTYRQIVSEFRLTLAKSFLTRTALPAMEIARLVGYSEPVNFYRAFKQRFAVSTKEFRQLSLAR